MSQRHPNGGRAKYLEIPFNDMLPGAMRAVGAEIANGWRKTSTVR